MMTENYVPRERIPHNAVLVNKEDKDAVQSVLYSGWIAQGEKAKQLQNYFTRIMGGGFSRVTSSGTSALFLALKGLKLKNDSLVGVPSYACSALLNAIRLAGHRPEIFDICENTLTAKFEKNYESLKKIHAAVAVHTFGAKCDFTICTQMGIPVIEDCCHTPGSNFAKTPLGSTGAAAIFSFYATKVITGGYGGLVHSNSQDFINEVTDFMEFDCRENYRDRFNFFLSDIQSAMILSQLKRLKSIIAMRKKISRIYDDALPEQFKRQTINEKQGGYPYRYVIFGSHKMQIEKLKQYLKDRKIDTIVPIKREELLHNYLKLSKKNFPVSETIAGNSLSLPIHSKLSETDVHYIAQQLKKFSQ